ncbi:leishmanolysin-related zinc metalloendopeptidase [Pseudonocardia sp. TRM90224]|uniref:leishmanolysin-related zinc metalloendopeptidase n=1 Tax=Pseudonocardia sp. TRM90224 TaxID=2812678 RepID=UPI001E39278E|nr:leishmanolysin-related zinc metalloendopeptidase [Pseudonocardia sp. TRM90224]
MTEHKAADVERYRATADVERAAVVAATDSPFSIEVRFLGGLTDRQRAAFAAAADRWTTVIVGDLPTAVVDGEEIDDVLILAEGSAIDGPGRVLGQAGPTDLRPASAGAAALLPVKGVMSFDTADLANMESDGTLDDVIAHEMGHVLGIGTLWSRKRLLAGSGTNNPTFTGSGAVAQYAALGRSGAVPVENEGGPGTREGHWRESVFGHELMSGFISRPGNPLSKLTAASLGDLGYQIDIEAAEPYTIPERVSAGSVVQGGHGGRGRVLPVIPAVLPG